MCRVQVIVPLSCALMLAACNRAPTASPTGSQKSVEQRVADLEEFVNSGAPRPSNQDLDKQAEQDLAEIRSLGLLDRAQRDFTNRVPGVVVENFRISYFRDTNVVWCSVTYKRQGGGDPRGQDFGYKRVSGTNWNLIWDVENRQ